LAIFLICRFPITPNDKVVEWSFPEPEEMMRYLCLIYPDEAVLDALSERDYAAMIEEVLAFREELRLSGRYIASSPLQPAEATTTVRVRNGRVSITDGPFAETKEQLGGFYLIEATDLNDAIRVAAKMPPARLGSIEVRPLREHNLDEQPLVRR
jgi:hypothetical protein